MGELILYTTDCPKCKILEAKLDMKSINYKIVKDVSEMQAMGIMSVPFLKIGQELMDFSKSISWINEY